VASVLVASALLLSGCGLPEDDEPQSLSAEDVPFDLLDPATTTIPQDSEGFALAEVTLYLVEDGLLVPVETTIQGFAEPEAALDTLLEGPENLNLGPALTTAIPADTEVGELQEESGVLTVDLSEEFQTVEGERSILATAQVVCTATDLDEIDGVRFRIEGEDITVNDAEGVEQDRPVRCADFRALSEPSGG